MTAQLYDVRSIFASANNTQEFANISVPEQEFQLFGNVSVPMTSGLWTFKSFGVVGAVGFGAIGSPIVPALTEIGIEEKYCPAKTSGTYDVTDASTMGWLAVAQHSGVYEFWKQPGEDIYSETDGTPV